MALYEQAAARLVGDGRAADTAFLQGYTLLRAFLEGYNAVGGEAGIAPHFVESDGVTPRTDLDYTQADIVAIATTANAVKTLMDQGHLTNLVKVKA